MGGHGFRLARRPEGRGKQGRGDARLSGNLGRWRAGKAQQYARGRGLSARLHQTQRERRVQHRKPPSPLRGFLRRRERAIRDEPRHGRLLHLRARIPALWLRHRRANTPRALCIRVGSEWARKSQLPRTVGIAEHRGARYPPTRRCHQRRRQLRGWLVIRRPPPVSPPERFDPHPSLPPGRLNRALLPYRG